MRCASSFAVGLVVLGVAARAEAGRSRFGWLYDTDVMAERQVELQTSMIEEDNVGPVHERTDSIWWLPVVGITDKLELALPVELTWSATDATPGNTTLARIGAELRYRLVTADPVDAPAVVPLVRLAVKRLIDQRKGARVEGDVVVSLDQCKWHATADLGAAIEVVPGDDRVELRPGVGVDYAVATDVRVGVEGFAQVVLRPSGGDDTWAAVGPDVAWTHGRFWLTASLPVGVHNIDAAPRIDWAVAF